MTSPDATPADRLADEIEDQIREDYEGADNPQMIMFRRDNWNTIIDALRRSTAPSGTVPGVARKRVLEVLYRVDPGIGGIKANRIASALLSLAPALTRQVLAQFLDDYDHYKTGTRVTWIDGRQDKALDDLCALVGLAPAVAHPEPEAAPTREEVECPHCKGLGLRSGNDGWDVACPTCRSTGQVSDPSSSPGGASVEALTDNELCRKWREAGGELHGPRVETGTMPQAKLLPFLRSLALAPQDGVEQMRREPSADEMRATIASLRQEADHYRQRYMDANQGSLLTEAKVATLEAERDECERQYQAAVAREAVELDLRMAAEARLAEATRLLEEAIRWAPAFVLADIAAFLARRVETEEASREVD